MIEVLATDTAIAPLVGAPGKRNIRVCFASRVVVDGSWDGGSRTTSRFVHFAIVWSGDRHETTDVTSAPTPALEDARPTTMFPSSPMRGYAPLVPGLACVQHSMFRGKDTGYTVVLHPADYDALVASRARCTLHDDCKEATARGCGSVAEACKASELSERDGKILACFRGLKSGPYRQNALRRLGYTDEDRSRLAARKLLKVAANGATAITPEGRIQCSAYNVA